MSIDPEPVLRIVRGNPTPAEVAALVTVLSNLGSHCDEPPAARSPWSRPEAMFRKPMPAPGPDAWVQSVR